MKFKLFGKFSKKRSYEFVSVALVTLPDVIFVVSKGYDAMYFPGGRLEGKEDDVSCIKRELKEELGMKLKEISEECIRTYVYSPKLKKHGLVKNYFGKVKGKLKVNEEEIEGVIIVPYKNVSKEWLAKINKSYLIGVSVIDVFVKKKSLADRIVKRL